MSRIGKSPIDIPAGVSVAVSGQQVSLKGPKGSLNLVLTDGLSATFAANKVTVSRKDDTKHLRAMHGTTRAAIQNIVVGVTKGYEKKLEIVGVGYKAVVQGKKVALNVGFANTIEVPIPDGVTVKAADANHLEISGIDKQKVGQTAAAIRAVRKPEPYKGKGVRYADEIVRKKAGKSAAAGGAKK